MMIKSASISPCARYRYNLRRRWSAAPMMIFVMLNPSVADAEHDDPTVRRCISFAQRERCGAIEVVNLFAFRSHTPKAMMSQSDPVGERNGLYIMGAMAHANIENAPVVCAWGAHGAVGDRGAWFQSFFRDQPLHCLGLTKAGEPLDPLYQPANAPLQPFGWLARGVAA